MPANAPLAKGFDVACDFGLVAVRHSEAEQFPILCLTSIWSRVCLVKIMLHFDLTRRQRLDLWRARRSSRSRISSIDKKPLPRRRRKDWYRSDVSVRRNAAASKFHIWFTRH